MENIDYDEEDCMEEIEAAFVNLFNTPTGEIVLRYLMDSYIIPSPFGVDERDTNYRVGQADLVRIIIELSKKEIG